MPPAGKLWENTPVGVGKWLWMLQEGTGGSMALGTALNPSPELPALRYNYGSEKMQRGQASGRHWPSPQAEIAKDFQQDPDIGHSVPTLPVQEVGLPVGKALASSGQYL